MDAYDYLIELRGVYDGWSIGVTADGTWVNRWQPTHHAFAATQAVIDDHNKEQQA